MMTSHASQELTIFFKNIYLCKCQKSDDQKKVMRTSRINFSSSPFASKMSAIIIHQIFSLARDWSKRVTWANIPQLKLGNIQDQEIIKVRE